jgi:hypothetical protein
MKDFLFANKKISVLVFALILLCGLILFLSFQKTHALSPCQRASFCYWGTWREAPEGPLVSLRLSLGVNETKLPNMLTSLDAFHGSILSTLNAEGDDEPDSPDFSFPAPPPEEAPEAYTVSPEYQILLQQLVDSLWNNAGMVIKGTLALKPSAQAGSAFSLARFFLRDTDFANSFLFTRLENAHFAFQNSPFAELSHRENIPKQIHHNIIQITVGDLFLFYDSFCTQESINALCNMLDKNNSGPFAILETLEELAGTDAAFDLHFYWRVHESHILFSNTISAFDSLSEWSPNQLLDAFEERSLSSNASVAHGVYAAPSEWSNMWDAVEDTVLQLASENAPWRGFLAFPDIHERMATLRPSIEPALQNPVFPNTEKLKHRGIALAWAFNDSEFHTHLFLENSEHTAFTSYEKSHAIYALTQFLSSVLPEIPSPAPSAFHESPLTTTTPPWTDLKCHALIPPPSGI